MAERTSACAQVWSIHSFHWNYQLRDLWTHHYKKELLEQKFPSNLCCSLSSEMQSLLSEVFLQVEQSFSVLKRESTYDVVYCSTGSIWILYISITIWREGNRPIGQLTSFLMYIYTKDFRVLQCCTYLTGNLGIVWSVRLTTYINHIMQVTTQHQENAQSWHVTSSHRKSPSFNHHYNLIVN